MAGNANGRKRGRKSEDDILREIYLALDNLHRVEFLETSSVGRFLAVKALAESNQYRAKGFPAGFALHHLLLDSSNAVLQDIGAMPEYNREVVYIRAMIAGERGKAHEILGLTREHVSRAVRPRAYEFIARDFLAKADMKVSSTP